MSSQFAFLTVPAVFACVVTIAVAQDSFCLWNRISASNLFATLNGLYEYAGDLNGLPYYENALPSDCAPPDSFYLYKMDLDEYGGDYSGWFIATSPGNLTISASCGDANTAAPSDCSWTFAGDSAPDSNTVVTAGNCPHWNCASITTTLTGGNGICAGPFDTQEAANVYSRQVAGYTYYLYYHEIYQTWRCSDTFSHACGAEYYGRSEQGWQSLSSGQSTTLHWPSIFGGAQDATITCTGSISITTTTSTTTTTATATSASTSSTSGSTSNGGGVSSSTSPSPTVNTPTAASLPTAPSATTPTLPGAGSAPTPTNGAEARRVNWIGILSFLCACSLFW